MLLAVLWSTKYGKLAPMWKSCSLIADILPVPSKVDVFTNFYWISCDMLISYAVIKPDLHRFNQTSVLILSPRQIRLLKLGKLITIFQLHWAASTQAPYHGCLLVLLEKGNGHVINKHPSNTVTNDYVLKLRNILYYQNKYPLQDAELITKSHFLLFQKQLGTKDLSALFGCRWALSQPARASDARLDVINLLSSFSLTKLFDSAILWLSI